MNQRELFKKTIAWTLITAMANPAAMAPAFARDTDIFLNTTTGSTTAEPNILIALGTNGRMNIAEPWREYPGAYDSHVEYLWNDITIINNGAEQTTESASMISTAVQPTNPFSKYGFWAGDTPAIRTALWTAAKNYANATEAGDPGVRRTYRNYSDASWIYWLPTGTAETDLRLMSIGFSRFRGDIKEVAGTRGGINWTTVNNYTANNKCTSSNASLLPSTVFAPTANPRNNGKLANQRWMRYENWRALTTVNNGGYPGSSTSTAGYARGYLDSSVAPPNTAYRDNVGGGPVGSQGQPIRIQGAGFAGWTDLKADFGGYIFQSVVNGMAAGDLTTLRGIYGYGLIAANEKFSAWKGNRDAAPAFGMETGTRGYYDTTPAACNATTGPASGTCINVATGGVSDITLYKTRTCNYGGGATENDATGFGRKRGGSCTGSVGNVCGVDISCTGDTNGAAYPNYSDVADPPPCPAATQKLNTFINLDYRSPAWSPARASVNIATCNWVGRQSVFIEEQGWFYYGGTCQETGSTDSCTMGGSPRIIDGTPYNNVSGPIANPGLTAPQILTTNCSNGGAFTAGPYYHGSICQGSVNSVGTVLGTAPVLTGPNPAPANSNIGGVTNPKIIRGVSYPNVVFNNATAGCNANADNNQTCSARGGYGGVQCDDPTPATACPPQQRQVTGGGTPASNQYYSVYNRSNNLDYMIHDCTADDGPGAYMRAANRNFNTAWNNGTNPASPTHSYSTAPGHAITADASKHIDTYSVNYLNWKFGPKGPNGDPIGRKTRLQIAKDALSSLVQVTNGVRFGLMVHNRTAGCFSMVGTIPSGSTVLTAGPNPGFVSGNPITVVGAGSGGGNLNANISSIAGDNFTLSAPAGAAFSTTGGITAGTDQLTVVSSAGFAVGNNITIAGAGVAGADLITRITAIVGLVLTLSGNAVTNVAGATVAPATGSTTGDIASGTNQITVASTAGLAVGSNITIAGAGAGGANLTTSITAIAGPVLTLNDPASTAVTTGPVVPIFSATATANPCSSAFVNDGANIAYKITRMGNDAADLPDYNNRAAMINAINNVVASSRTPLTETLYEAYRYYSGRTPRFGTLTTAALAGGQVTQGRDTTAVCSAAGVGCPASGVYRSPMLNNPNTTSPAACQKNFVILITNGQPEDDWSANAEIKTMSYAGTLGAVSPKTNIDAAQPDTATFQLQTGADPAPPYGPVDFAGTTFDGGYIWLDELTYFMSRADVSPGARNFAADAGADLIEGRQSVITYTIGFAGVDTPVVSNAALASGGIYYLAQDSGALSAALTDAIVSIVNWNPTIASPSVPISALNRTENATDIYLSFFQPDPSQAWKGTLKKYALGTTEALCGDGVTLCLTGQTVLANPITCGTQTATCKNIEKVEVDPITSATNVVVHEDAVSYWNPLLVIDGSQPAQGGSGYQLLNTGGYNPSTRNVYTFLTNGVSSSTALTNATNRVRDTNALINTATVITGTGSDAERSKLINFVLGGDSGVGACADASGAATACTTWRAWAHSDVQHSKPVIVTYDATTGPPVQYVFYTSNDGLLHAVDANTGQEKWAFLIEEAYSKLITMFNDNAGPSLDVADGQISLWTYDDLGDGKIETAADKAYLFFGLRRGGSAYYALDVSSRDAPVFKWKIAGGGSGSGKLCVGNSACAAVANYDELGQTWSAATVGKVRAPSGAGTVALFFGGGFDPAEDTIPRGARTMGRGVFVVNSETGDVINSWGVGQAGAYRAGSGTMAYAIPSDVTALNTDVDAQGFIDRVYVGDMGGNVWRMDVNNPTATAWRAKQLASLSEATGESRKFLFAPAAVKQNTPERFDAVYIGSGDREHPLTTSTSLPFSNANRDKMFMLKDDYQLEATAGAPLALGNLLDRPEGDTSQLTDADIANPVKGWIVGLQDGEKVINAPTVFFNKLRFGTYAPLAQANACAPPGASRLNEIDALTGNFFDLNVGDGLTSTDRWYGSTSTGYISTGQIIVLGKNIYHIVASPLLQYQLIGTIGAGTKIYWYMEPEQ